MKSVSFVDDVPYVDRGTAVFVCMNREAFGLREAFDAAGYCLDAVDRIPAGGAVRFESDTVWADYVFGECSYR